MYDLFIGRASKAAALVRHTWMQALMRQHSLVVLDSLVFSSHIVLSIRHVCDSHKCAARPLKRQCLPPCKSHSVVYLPASYLRDGTWSSCAQAVSKAVLAVVC